MWFVWRYARGDPARWAETLIDPSTGEVIDSCQRGRLMAFKDAVRIAEKSKLGIAFAIDHTGNHGDSLVVLIVRECIDDGGIVDPGVVRIVKELDTYAELSPDGRDLRIWMWGYGCPRSKGPFELARGDRVISVTGRHLDGTPDKINRNTDVLVRICEELFEDETTTRLDASGIPKPQSAHIPDEAVELIPLEVRQAKRWVAWKWKWKPPTRTSQGKWDKPPIDPRNGLAIDETDQANWMTFDEARVAAREHGDGTGIALGPKDNRAGVVGIDLDHCIGQDGDISPQAAEIVDDFRSYTERTPSGTGLRILIWGDKPGARCRTKDFPDVEIYEADRYLTVTGRHLEGMPTQIHRRDEELKSLYDEMFSRKAKPGRGGATITSKGAADASDDELIDKARHAKNGAKFSALFDHGDTSEYSGDDSAADMALMNILAFWTGRDASRMEAIFGRSALGQRDKWTSRTDYREWTIDNAIENCTDVYGSKSRRKRKGPSPSSNGDGEGRDLPEIEVNTQRQTILDRTIMAVVKDPDLYCRGDTLGVVIQEQGDTSSLAGGIELRNVKGNLRFIPLSKSVLGCRLTQNASFFYWKKGKHGEDLAVDCDPPDWLIAAVAEHRYWPGLRELLSITQIPFVLADGSLSPPGFDRTTGTLYQPSIETLDLPEQPTRAEAIEARDRLYQLVYQFPFENGYSFAVWLAALLSAIQRPVIEGPVPGFVFNGNKAGCGKGLLIDIIGYITLGHRVATRTYPADPNEAEKVKVALALAAVPIVHFDNLIEGGLYGGSVMDSALTSTITSGRILGQSRDSGNVPLRPVWMVSGNNVSPTGDADRRWLPCNLVTILDRPHERSDILTEDLRKHVLENRAEILRDACIILKAHAIAGRPRRRTKEGEPTAPLGSFEEWDLIVRGAVWYATWSDCLHTQRMTSDEMPSRMNKEAFLEGWKEIDPHGKGKTVDEALAAVDGDPTKYATLRLAFMSMSKDGKMPTVDRVGYKLRAMKRTPVNGMRFEKCGKTEDRNHQSVWKVVAC